MARMRRGARWNLIFPLVAFVIIAMVTTVLSIFFYNDLKKSDAALTAKSNLLDRYIQPSERTAFEQNYANPPKGMSLAMYVDKQLRDLKQIVQGSPDVSLDTIRSAWKDAVPDSLPLITEINKLEAQHTADKEASDAKDDQIKKLNGEVAAAGAAQAAAADTYKKSTDDLGNTVSTMEKDYGGQVAKLNQTIDAMTKAKDQNLQDARDNIKKLENDVAEKDQEILGLRHRITELMPKRAEGTPLPDTSLQPKGHIVSILEDANLAYIDRGRRDHVVPGLTFEVYDHSTGVVKDEHGELRGKATIEVMTVLEDSSVCRIVRRSPRTTLIEGDILANAVYDPNYRFKFVVFGDFDIDKTGQASETDKQRIKSTIIQWGGTVTNDLTYDTDFLVLGIEPKFPDPLPTGGTVDPAAITKRTRQLEKYKEYQSLIAQAKSFSIPILNQNRFLALVGYYKR